jgi:hypothetical protein
MINIKPILVGLPAKIANKLLVRPIINSTTDTSCNTYYEVISEEIVINPSLIEGEFDTTNTIFTIVATGNVPINDDQYTEWAADNAYIEDIVLIYLGIERE